MDKWEAAYIAGIIDGEGSIILTRMHDKELGAQVLRLLQRIKNFCSMRKV